MHVAGQGPQPPPNPERSRCSSIWQRLELPPREDLTSTCNTISWAQLSIDMYAEPSSAGNSGFAYGTGFSARSSGEGITSSSW
jgi:hypothetical protein